MSRQFEDLLDEDECCLNCGELDYRPSKIMGLCFDCFTDPKRSLEIEKQNDSDSFV
jgi:NMD protein affecting ribosome stability and mRNA decay